MSGCLPEVECTVLAIRSEINSQFVRKCPTLLALYFTDVFNEFTLVLYILYFLFVVCEIFQWFCLLVGWLIGFLF